ncbi:bifunctional diguanylate cyclase/phosphodiesterase [Salinicola avicenniae]|uniref:bifunctional diguanylate cyclase/phosphodiesterase n=1 Tax=Salinicola avicenniae TaxID=2916836 RepID=UPI002073AFD5|nr:sensor domain-containing phosphodiesterase [Salinicola sp. S1-1-8]
MGVDRNLNNSERHKLAMLKAQRLAQLGPDRSLDQITKLVTQLLGVPTSLVTLLGTERQWIKAKYNFLLSETPADLAICQRTVERNELTVIEDTVLDHEYRDSPLVLAEPHIRFYAGAPLVTSEGHPIGCVCAIDYQPRKLTDRERETLLSLAELARDILETSNNVGFIDVVTMLPNRQKLLRDLETLHERPPEQQALPSTLMFVETTKPGYYYELVRAFGIDAVESQSQDIANLLRISLPPSHILYAVTLSRFAILLRQDDKADTFEVLESLGARVSGREFRTRLPIRLNLKAGYYDFEPALTKPVDAFRRAFSALHEALNNASTTTPYSESFDEVQRRQLDLTNGMASALDASDQLYLLYQPKVSLLSGEVVGIEALLRWRHPQYGEVPPMDFIPLISQTTLINPLTRWIICEAAQAIKRFEREGLSMVVSVNVTNTNLVEDEFAADVLSILAEYGAAPGYLEIECLEMEELLQDIRAVEALQTLKAAGVRVALDDFGSGYSNLNYLRRIPADVVKLDRSLISDIARDAGSRAIVFRLIQMLQHFGFEIVAEGIEDQETVDCLTKFRCDTGQGYYFDRPLTLEDVLGATRKRLGS